MASCDDREDRPVDSRVQCSIEALNAAIDRVNHLEDTKQCTESSAARTRQAIAQEIDLLRRDHAPVERMLVPLMEARRQTIEAMAAARAAEAKYAAALDEVQLAQEALQPLRGPAASSADPQAARELEHHLRCTMHSAAKRAASLKREAKRARAAANHALQKLGKAGERVERRSQLEAAFREDNEYRTTRQGMQEVFTHYNDRLAQIESEKIEAVAMVQSAMGQLEDLSNELHVGARRSEGAADGQEEARGSVEPEVAARD
ncbi:hypothetical protein AB1Y20_012152 [Prymnesium parvum]|uniref:Nuf2 DHR10-like domain-containing protein n=1 Tax=Prymnesium parvum TaxID=97485 RepID=A0AB34IQG0_PRYPA